MSPLVLDGDDPRSYTVRISFPQAQFNTGILENGNYQVPLPANSISSASDGQPLAEEYTLTLWFLNGDADRSRGIDAADYAIIDASYSVTGLTDTSGVVQERFVYDPYGKVTVLDTNWATDSDGQSDFNWAYLHQSGRKDGTTGLSHFRFREQSASLGRWTTNDPIGYADGANRYEFVSSAPNAWVDPLGLSGAATSTPISTGASGSAAGGPSTQPNGSGRARDFGSDILGRPLQPGNWRPGLGYPVGYNRGFGIHYFLGSRQQVPLGWTISDYNGVLYARPPAPNAGPGFYDPRPDTHYVPHGWDDAEAFGAAMAGAAGGALAGGTVVGVVGGFVGGGALYGITTTSAWMYRNWWYFWDGVGGGHDPTGPRDPTAP